MSCWGQMGLSEGWDSREPSIPRGRQPPRPGSPGPLLEDPNALRSPPSLTPPWWELTSPERQATGGFPQPRPWENRNHLSLQQHQGPGVSGFASFSQQQRPFSIPHTERLQPSRWQHLHPRLPPCPALRALTENTVIHPEGQTSDPTKQSPAFRALLRNEEVFISLSFRC